MSRVKQVLLVCTGNSCRSVIAKGLMKEMLGDRKDVMVVSAGVAAMPGFRPTQETITIMAEHGIDVSSHLTQRLTNRMVEESDLVLVMEKMHKDEIVKRVPHAKKKVYLLREYADTSPNAPGEISIPDPIAKPMEVYAACFRMIQESVEKVVKKI